MVLLCDDVMPCLAFEFAFFADVKSITDPSENV